MAKRSPDVSWQDAIGSMLRRIETTATSLAAGFPHYGDPDTGSWTTSPAGDWTGGHWVGELWLASADTAEPRYREWAARWCAALRPRASSDTIFRSFLFYYGAALGDILCNDPNGQAIGLEGARGLAAMYNARAQVLPLGGEAEEASDVGDGEASIDAVGSICGLLAWASEKTGDESCRRIAREHALRHIDFCVREDGSVGQSATFDKQTGAVLRRYTHKGYSERSTWGRAQAWGMLAYVLAARWIPGERAFLEAAEMTAEWWLARVPVDNVAYWDFDDPAIPNTFRDTSATAIAAAALLKLAALAPDRARGQRYREAAEDTVQALVAGYLTPTDAEDRRPPGILTQGCYNPRIGLATRNELIWGDYYLFEALQVLAGRLSPLAV